MGSFIFAISAVLPLIIMVAIGYILKRFGVVKQDFAAVANKLVFRIFLPATLFLNVYKIESAADIDVRYVFSLSRFPFSSKYAILTVVPPRSTPKPYFIYVSP